ncbi:MAG: NAD(P)-dependent oxidoreductase [Pyramidobacter sp.]|jgi:phosphoglycerate dehydrogenase-like enzyme
MRPVITVIEPEGPEEWFAPLKEYFDVRFYRPKGALSPSEVSSLLDSSFGVIITSATSIGNDQLDCAARLKIIAKCGGPPSNLDVAHAEARGIVVTCTPGANTTTIAEYTIMLMIAALRGFGDHLAAVRRCSWRSAGTFLGHDLRDSVVGIVGLGAIGTEVVKRLLPFGCKIRVFTPHPSATPGCEFVHSLEELLSQCDVVSLHCRVTPETVNLLNAENLRLMRPGAVLINTARGALVDETALSETLKHGPLGAAAVDVFQQEPPPANHPLLSCKNALLTPHSSGWTLEALRRECTGAVDSIIAFVQGRPIPGLLTSKFSKNGR